MSKWYGSFQVLKNCTTQMEKGEVVVVCGPSGSGKSTLIKCVNGLEPFQQGDIVVNGESVSANATNLNRLRSKIGMVFQSFELFPHLKVIDNINLGQVKVLGRSAEEGDRQVDEPLEARRAQPTPTSSRPALGRPAAAGRDRARARHGPDRDAVRRADLGARPGDDQRGARRDGRSWPRKA